MSGRHRFRRDASLMQIAAAIVGSAAATQVIAPTERATLDEATICRDPHCPDRGGQGGSCPAEHLEAWRHEFPDGAQ